jgi:adenine phosphoribosyltransferase
MTMELRNGVNLKNYIRTIPDYPKAGIMFRDVTTLIADPVALRAAVDELLWPFLRTDLKYVVGIEARGFILGGAIAHELGLGFIPIRKKGKLPGKTITRTYALEYGEDAVEIHDDALSHGEKVLLVDDLIATGGTAEAALDLLQETGADVVAASFIVDLPDLGGKQKLLDRGVQVHTLVEFEGD